MSLISCTESFKLPTFLSEEISVKGFWRIKVLGFLHSIFLLLKLHPEHTAEVDPFSHRELE